MEEKIQEEEDSKGRDKEGEWGKMHKTEKEYRENKERQVGNYEDNKGREREENVRGGRITNDRISEEKGKKPRWGGGDNEESKIRDERGRGE